MTALATKELANAAPAELPRRLCSEIKLFDLCELERCRYRDGRYCNDPEMIARFEAAAEPEDRPVWPLGQDEREDDENLVEGFDDEGDYHDLDDADRHDRDDDW